MKGFLTYAGLFIVAVVVMQLFVFDSVRVSMYFSPLAYIAFVVLLPMNMKPLAVLLLGLVTGVFVDFFAGTHGLHTAATLFTAFTRRWMMILTLGRETVDEPGTVGEAMPSTKLLGEVRFWRYAALLSGIHCLVLFSLESLTWTNFHLVAVKSLVSGVFTLVAVWLCSVLFTVKTQKRVR